MASTTLKAPFYDSARIARERMVHAVKVLSQAAQGDLIHNDDTTMKILSLVQENKDRTASRNTTDEFNAILCNCLTHGRRNFVDEIDNFPEESEHVIDVLAEVYGIDDRTKKENMTPEQRLACHKEHSGPLMTDLKSWMDRQIDENLVEPNSGLGKAIAYMNNHWTKLTRFLEVPGAPLDNNICERSLKRCIQHRKNSLFYKTEHGACIKDPSK